MSYKEGQALFIKLPFADGGEPHYPRPFLIVEARKKSVELLNISSLKGKELKVMRSTKNRIIKDYNPPFFKPSFVKLDALYIVEKNKKLKTTHMANGTSLSEDELQVIKNRLDEYRKDNEFQFAEQRINTQTFYKYN